MATRQSVVRALLGKSCLAGGLLTVSLLAACGGGSGSGNPVDDEEAPTPACTTPNQQSDGETIQTADDIAVIAKPGDAARFDVLHNDSANTSRLELISVTSDLETLEVGISEDRRYLEAISAIDSAGTAKVRYLARSADGVSCAEGALTVYIDTWFQPVYDLLERRQADGRRLVDIFDANSLRPFEPQLLLQVKLNDRLVLHRQWGEIDADLTRLPIDSASKWLAATVSLLARDKQVVSLSDSYIDWLPEFAAPLLDARSFDRSQITLLQAFSMSHGLSSAHRYANMRNLGFDASVEAIRAGLGIDEECIPGITCGAVPVAYQPGTHLGYDNKGFQVAGRALLAAYLGQYTDWPSLAERELFEPCEMSNSAYEARLPNPAVASGVVTTAADYMRFLDMIANGGSCGDNQILSAESLDMFFTYHTTASVTSQSEAPIWKTPWPNCSDTSLAGGQRPQDCSQWPDGEPTGGTIYDDNKDNLRYTYGAWGMAEDSGDVELVASPGARGVFPFFHRNDNYWGLFFTQAPIIETPDYLIIEQYTLHLIQQRIDQLLRSGEGELAPTENL